MLRRPSRLPLQQLSPSIYGAFGVFGTNLESLNGKRHSFSGERSRKLQTHRTTPLEIPAPSASIPIVIRARSHCRCALPLIRFTPDSLRELVPLFLKQQRDRTLRWRTDLPSARPPPELPLVLPEGRADPEDLGARGLSRYEGPATYPFLHPDVT